MLTGIVTAVEVVDIPLLAVEEFGPFAEHDINTRNSATTIAQVLLAVPTGAAGSLTSICDLNAARPPRSEAVKR